MKENTASQSGIFNRHTITLLVVYRLVRVVSLLAVVGFLSSRADAQFLYVNNNGSPNTISAFHVNSAGTLTPVAGAPFPTGGTGGVCFDIASTRTIHPSGGRLYATNSLSGNVSGFNIANDGSLTTIPGSPFPMSPGGNPIGVAASANGQFLFVGRDFFPPAGGAGIDVFQINADGSLTLVPGSPFGVGGGAGFDVLFDARRKNVISDVNDNEVSVFSAANTGALVPILGSPFTTPTFNNHKMALGSQGSCLFVAGGASGSVSAMQVARDGSLSNAPGSPVATGNVFGAATTQQGSFAYFGGSSGISGFSFDNRCSLTPIPGSPFISGGSFPAGVTTEGSGKFLFAVHHVSASVSSFRIAPNGSLTLIGTSPLQGLASCPVGLVAYPVIVGPPASR
jgi:6-phosphogluconolactonase